MQKIKRFFGDQRVYTTTGYTKPDENGDPYIKIMYHDPDLREAKTTAMANENDQFIKILVKEFGVGCLYRWVNKNYRHPTMYCHPC